MARPVLALWAKTLALLGISRLPRGGGNYNALKSQEFF
jgi:hypothetical protein